jgi:MYXO-CTERM domain-containing protein
MKALLRGTLATLVGSVALFAASTASAAGEACYNDNDCPGGGQVCGGEVCNWFKANPTPVGEKAYTCVTAGADAAKGSDGWCTGDATCKCMAQGAKCMGVHCTFTKASDAPAGTGGTAAGGTAAGGSAPTAGTAATTAGTAATTAGTASGGTASTPAPAADEGGCSVTTPGSTNTGIALGVALVGLGLAFARRRAGG